MPEARFPHLVQVGLHRRTILSTWGTWPDLLPPRTGGMFSAPLAFAEVLMSIMRLASTSLAVAGLAALASVHASSNQQGVPIPQPGVPQIMTLEGKFVRVAYNNEGYV